MNTILVRVDGKGFSKFTKPFREEGVYGVYSPIIQKHMLAAAQGLVERVDGAVGAYTISDEISLLFEDRGQDTWYAGRHDKIVSLTAAYATAYFNEDLFYRGSTPAVFDSRVVDLDEEELSLAGYILDRRSRGFSNAVGSYAVQTIGHKHVLGVPTHERLAMLENKGVRMAPQLMYGFLVYKKEYTTSVVYTHKKTGEDITVPNVQRSRWETVLFENEGSVKLVVK